MACAAGNSEQYLLDLFKDNTSNDIKPIDLRDFVTQIYAEAALKEEIIDDGVTTDPCATLSSSMGKILTDGKENTLGNPVLDDYIFSSKASGTRSWVPNIVTLAGLSDTSTTGVAIGDSLEWSGTAWIPKAVTTIVERGGIGWNAVEMYKVGDIVTDSVAVYFALLDNNGAGSQPSSNPGTWQVISNTVSELSDLADVTMGVVSPGEHLTVNAGGQFVNSNFTTDSKVVIQNSLVGENGSIAITPDTGDATKTNIALVADINALGDVDTTPINDDVLTYNGTTWVNKQPSTLGLIETGGIAWNGTSTFAIGDIVSFSSNIYIAITSNTTSQPDTNPLDWLFVNVSEKGGIAWRTGIYNTGDIVGHNNAVWLSRVAANITEPSTSGDWIEVITNEYLGAGWDANKQYGIGDIVSEAGEVFVCLALTTNELPSTSPTKWKATIYDEVGGLVFDLSKTYNTGDIVSHNADVYTSLFDLNIGQDPVTVPGAWKAATASEQGGIIWDNAKVYGVGSTISYNAGLGFKMYIAISSNSGVQPDSDPSIWLLSSDYELGGRAYIAGETYKTGDLTSVVDTSGPTIVQTFIALVDNPSSPSLVPTDWLKLDVAETGGKSWDGLKQYMRGDIVTVGIVTYIALSDNLLNIDPTTNPLQWHNGATDEQGGIVWKDAVDYFLGDIISFKELIYVAKQDIPINAIPIEPDADPLWETWRGDEYGGLGWDQLKRYDRGDIVSVGSQLYIAMADNLEGPLQDPTDPVVDPLNPIWYNASQPEAGGIAWSGITSYKIGDIVFNDTPSALRNDLGPGQKTIYIAIANIPYVAPASNLAPAWSIDAGEFLWASLDIRNQDGIAWDSTLTYLDGDIVAKVGVDGVYALFVCKVATTTTDPSSLPRTDWDLVTKLERGGVDYSVLINYQVGDLAIHDHTSPSGIDTREVYKCIAANMGNWDSNEWQLLDTDTNINTTHRPTVDYEIDDIVAVNGIIYIATQANGPTLGNTAAPGTDETIWEDLSSEKGGIEWSGDTINYIAGDIVSRNTGAYPGTGYELFAALTDIAANMLNDDPYVDVTSPTPVWEAIKNDEIAGRLWQTNVLYESGDLVTFNNITYTAINPVNGVTDPSGDPTNWASTQPVPNGTASGDILRWNGTTWIPAAINKFPITGDNTNTVFPLAGSIATSGEAWINGSLQRETVDFDITPGFITFTTVPNAGDWIQVNTIG